MVPFDDVEVGGGRGERREHLGSSSVCPVVFIGSSLRMIIPLSLWYFILVGSRQLVKQAMRATTAMEIMGWKATMRSQRSRCTLPAPGSPVPQPYQLPPPVPPTSAYGHMRRSERVVIDVVRAKVGPRGANEWHVQTNLLVERTLEDGSVVMEQAPIPPPDAANRARAVVDSRALYRIGPELHALIADSKLNKDFFFRTSPDQ